METCEKCGFISLTTVCGVAVTTIPVLIGVTTVATAIFVQMALRKTVDVQILKNLGVTSASFMAAALVGGGLAGFTVGSGAVIFD